MLPDGTGEIVIAAGVTPLTVGGVQLRVSVLRKLVPVITRVTEDVCPATMVEGLTELIVGPLTTENC